MLPPVPEVPPVLPPVPEVPPVLPPVPEVPPVLPPVPRGGVPAARAAGDSPGIVVVTSRDQSESHTPQPTTISSSRPSS